MTLRNRNTLKRLLQFYRNCNLKYEYISISYSVPVSERNSTCIFVNSAKRKLGNSYISSTQTYTVIITTGKETSNIIVLNMLVEINTDNIGTAKFPADTQLN